jgi:signal transduction histidine kinase
MPMSPRFPVRREQSLEYRVPLLITLLLVGVLSVALGVAFFEVRASASMATNERLERLAEQMGDLIGTTTSGREALVRQVARTEEIRRLLATGEAAGAAASLARLRGAADSQLEVAVWNLQRETVLELPSTVRGPREMAAFPAEGGYGPAFELGDTAFAYVAAPVLEDGQPVGYVVQLRRLSSPQTEGGLTELVGPDATVYMIDRADQWIALNGGIEANAPSPVGLVEIRNNGGETLLAHVSQPQATNWKVAVAVPAASANARATGFLRRTAALMAMLILVGAVAAWSLSRRMTRPLRSLGEAARSIASGDYSGRVEVRRADEVGMLSHSFNVMAAQVQSAHSGLQHQVEQARALAAELEAANRRLQELMIQAEMAQKAAEDASRAKTNFLATVSHELRTPINAIMGYADLLLLGIPDRPTTGQVEHISRVQRNSRHLTRLVDDLLDLAKIEAGQLGLVIEVGSAEDAVDAAISTVGPLGTEKGVELVPDVESGGHFRGDRRRVDQILINLIGNAVKFTPAGGRIEVRCRRVSGDSLGSHPQGFLAFEIVDTGIGVPPEKTEVIFERFVQAETGYRRTHEGAGLGLAISRELARLMGGDITLRSEEGKGSCFTLLLPAADQGRESGSASESRPLARSTPRSLG